MSSSLDRQLAAAVAHGDDDSADAFALHELGQFRWFDGRDARDLRFAADIARNAQAEFRALQDGIH